MNKFIGISVLAGIVLLPMAAFASPDTTPPVISLFGGAVSAPQGGFVDPGYSATDNVDGNITSRVAVTGLGTDPGSYTLNYNVSDVAGNAAITQTRSVSIYANGLASPCIVNGTCPCPISADPITGDRAAWKSCAMMRYPKLEDGSTLVCRLTPVMAGDPIKCATDQAGFGEMIIKPDGTEVLK